MTLMTSMRTPHSGSTDQQPTNFDPHPTPSEVGIKWEISLIIIYILIIATMFYFFGAGLKPIQNTTACRAPSYITLPLF